MQTQPRAGFWREPDGTAIAKQDAYEAWAHAAYPKLLTVATGYHRWITYGDLGDEVQNTTGIRTSLPVVFWIGGVLALVVAETHRRGDPPLTALVVHADDHMVGEGYKLALSIAGEAPIEDVFAREDHAAEARLACYRRFSTEIPADGGTAALPPKLHAKRYGKQPAAEIPIRVCRNCRVELPVSGVCDDCG